MIERQGQNIEQTDELYIVPNEAVGRLTSRLLIEKMGITIGNLPIGGKEGLALVLGFMPKAKEGFVLTLKSDEMTAVETPDMLEITKSVHEDLADILRGTGTFIRQKVISIDKRVPLYFYCKAAMMALSSVAVVDSASLNLQTEGTSFWPYRLSKEDIWGLMTEIGNTTQTMITTKESAGGEEIFRAIHFFASLRVLAEEVK